jgi:hypothetical protein
MEPVSTIIGMRGHVKFVHVKRGSSYSKRLEITVLLYTKQSHNTLMEAQGGEDLLFLLIHDLGTRRG